MKINRHLAVHVAMAACLSLAAPAYGQLDISWSTIDGGGETFSTGGGFELGGTIGQPDAGAVMTGGGYELSGGFWAGPVEGRCPGDLDGDGGVGLSDLATLLAHYAQPGPWSYEDGDLDGDGDVDLSDLAGLLAVYGTTCP